MRRASARPVTPRPIRRLAFGSACCSGSGKRLAAQVTGGGFSGWLTDEAVLINSRTPGSVNEQVLWRLDLAADGAPAAELERCFARWEER